jgi:hypothetical protein
MRQILLRPLLMVFPDAGLLIDLAGSTQTTRNRAWQKETSNWNQAGAPIPQALGQKTSSIPACQHVTRPPTLPDDDQVTATGWPLTNAAQFYRATQIVTGMANAAAMYRPIKKAEVHRSTPNFLHIQQDALSFNRNRVLQVAQFP